MDEKKKFNWTEFVAVIFLVGLTAVVSWGVTWYIMDGQIQDEQTQNDSLTAQVAAYKAQIKSLQDKTVSEETSQVVTPAMVEGGTYTLGGVNVVLVNGKATVGVNTYTLDTQNVAYNSAKTKAVAVIKETTGTPATTVNTYAVTVTAKDSKVSQVASVALADDATVSSVSYGSDGKVTVVTTTTGSTTTTTTVYSVSGTSLVATK